MSNNPETPDTPGTPRTPGTPERAQPETGGIPSDPTRAIEVDQPSTSSAGAGEPVWADEGTANRTEPLDTAILGRYDDTLPDDARATEAGRAHEDRAHDGQGRNGQAQAWPPAVPPRPTGLHLPPILLGIVCLAIAFLTMWQELGRVSIDWGNVGPLGIVAIGGLLTVLGLVGVLSSRRRATD